MKSNYFTQIHNFAEPAFVFLWVLGRLGLRRDWGDLDNDAAYYFDRDMVEIWWRQYEQKVHGK